MKKYIIKTNKGYIRERDDYKTYPINPEAFVGFSGNFFNMRRNSGVDMLGFTDDREEAKRYVCCIGNEVQKIIDRIKDGYEPNIKYINVEVEE